MKTSKKILAILLTVALLLSCTAVLASAKYVAVKPLYEDDEACCSLVTQKSKGFFELELYLLNKFTSFGSSKKNIVVRDKQGNSVFEFGQNDDYVNFAGETCVWDYIGFYSDYYKNVPELPQEYVSEYTSIHVMLKGGECPELSDEKDYFIDIPAGFFKTADGNLNSATTIEVPYGEVYIEYEEEPETLLEKIIFFFENLFFMLSLYF